MSIDPKLLEVLACPSCKGKLVYYAKTNELVSRAERLAYPIDDGIPVLIVDKARVLDAEELEQIDA